MSAEIIAFPLRAPAPIDQQRWIPDPRPRQDEPRLVLSVQGFVRLAAVLSLLGMSWGLFFGAARLVAVVL